MPIDPTFDPELKPELSQVTRIAIANQTALLDAQRLNDEYKHAANKRFFASIGGVLAVAFVAYISMRSEVLASAKERADAGTAVLREEVKSLDIRTRRTEDRVERVEKIVEAVAKKLRINDLPDPLPPPQKDGGGK